MPFSLLYPFLQPIRSMLGRESSYRTRDLSFPVWESLDYVRLCLCDSMSFKNLPNARFLLCWADHNSSASSSGIPILISPANPWSSHNPTKRRYMMAHFESVSTSFNVSPPFEILIPEPKPPSLILEPTPFLMRTIQLLHSIFCIIKPLFTNDNPSSRWCNTLINRFEIEPSFKVNPIQASRTLSSASSDPSRLAPQGPYCIRSHHRREVWW